MINTIQMWIMIVVLCLLTLVVFSTESMVRSIDARTRATHAIIVNEVLK